MKLHMGGAIKGSVLWGVGGGQFEGGPMGGGRGATRRSILWGTLRGQQSIWGEMNMRRGGNLGGLSLGGGSYGGGQ